MTEHRWFAGRRSGVLLEAPPAAPPILRAWGPAPEPGETTASVRAAGEAVTPAQTQASVDAALPLDLLPMHASGFQGSPALRGAFLDGTGWAPRLDRVGTAWREHGLDTVADDTTAGLRLHLEVRLDGHDVLHVRAAVTNRRGLGGGGAGGAAFPDRTPGLGRPRDRRPDPDDYRLDALRITLPVGDQAREIASFAGRWIYAYLQAGEHLRPGEIVLRPGETYASPTVYAVASDRGMNGVSDAFHAHVRARPNHPRGPRPATLNTWDSGPWARPASVRLPGFVRDRRYRIELLDLLTDAPAGGRPPAWYTDGVVEVGGALLGDHGIALHAHHPQTVTVVSATALDA